jgi:hypothetical protein
MNTYNKKVESNRRPQEAKKSWTAPEATRLDFPKTANGVTGINPDGAYGTS